MKMLEKKGQDCDPKEKAPKMEILRDLVRQMSAMINEDMAPQEGDPMQKVTVAGDDPESLEMGLDKAKEMLSQKGESMPLDMDEEDEDYV